MASKPQLLAFLHTLGINKNNVEYSEKGWSRCSCPLAPFTHRSGQDSNPSFGINSHEGKLVYNCFSCGSGTLDTLISTLEFHLQRKPEYSPRYNLSEARAMLDSASFNYIPLPDFEDALAEVAEVIPWDENFLNSFPLASKVSASLKYLQERGVTVDDCEKFDIRYDTMRREVCFPIRDVYGRLTGMRGRSINPLCDPKFRHYDHTYDGINNSALVFLNEQSIASMEPVVVVEGQFDMNKVAKTYPHVMANLTSGISGNKLERLLQAEAVLLMLDNDETGRKKAAKITEYLYNHNQSVASVFIGKDGQDPDNCSHKEIYDALAEYIDVKLLTNY